MCRSHDQGHRRCVNNPQKQNSEALRKAIGYQAKKAGMSSSEWKSENPELLKIIQDTYAEKLDTLKAQEELVDPTHAAHTPVLSYVDENNEETITGVITPLQAAKMKPIEEYGFQGEKEPRLYNGTLDFNSYLRECNDAVRGLELTEREKTAIEAYTCEAYEVVNRYLLGTDNGGEFDRDAYDGATEWHEYYATDLSYFYSEKDMLDYMKHLDSALNKRNDEHQILYRGMGFIIPKSTQKDDKKAELESNYAVGNEIVFDGYSSTSVVPDVASSFSRMHLNGDNYVGVQYELRTNAGVPVAHLSGNDTEREILLPRGIRYKVVNSYWDKNNYTYEGIDIYEEKTTRINKSPNMLIVQLVEVDDNGEEIAGTEDHKAPELTPKYDEEDLYAEDY